MDALKLAGKVKSIIAKHIQAKGYEVEVVLQTPAAGVENRDALSIEDDGQPEPQTEAIKIVVTAHSIDEKTMELGDNPAEVLKFIVIEDGTEPDIRQIKEGRILEYDGKQFEIKLVAPAALAGQLIVKECRAERVGVNGRF